MVGNADGTITFWNAVGGKIICNLYLMQIAFKLSTTKSQESISYLNLNYFYLHLKENQLKFGLFRKNGEMQHSSPKKKRKSINL